MSQEKNRPSLDDIDETPRYGCTSQQIKNIKEHLKRDLAGGNDLSELDRKFFWAILTGEGLIDYYLGRMRFFQSWSDEIPQKLIHFGHYKCRGNFVTGLRGVLSSMVSRGIDFDGETRAQIAEYLGDEWDFTRRTTPQEIAFSNQIIDKIIEELERLI